MTPDTSLHQPPSVTAMTGALLAELPEFEILEACLGLYWTAVVAETPHGRRCGLASTLPAPHGHHGEFGVPQAGELETLPGREVAGWLESDSPLQRSLGLAALNAALPPLPGACTDENASKLVARLGRERTVALIGHFPFVETLRPQVRQLWVLEKNPQPGDLPSERAPEILPQAEVVAITGMTMANHSLPELLAHCPPGAEVLLLGPSTPLSTRLAEFGITWLGGSLVEDIAPVVRGVRQGATFRQLHHLGVRLITCPIHVHK